jgi:hypothetical protein
MYIDDRKLFEEKFRNKNLTAMGVESTNVSLYLKFVDTVLLNTGLKAFSKMDLACQSN